MEDAAVQDTGLLFAIVVAIVIGGVAGWLAALIVQGTGLGLVGDIVVGMAGAIVAAFLFPTLGVSIGGGVVSAIVASTLGAVIGLLIVRVAKRV